MSKMDYPDIDDPSWISTPEERAYNYARRLAEILSAKHFPPNPDWQPLPDLLGVIYQIDNMTTALVHKDKINEALERAAAVADARDLSIMSTTSFDMEARRIAAAIRALKGNTP